MADIFISYASEDREHANKLATALGARGWSIWWDRKIIAGEAFDQAIERQLDAAKCVVVLWSRNSVSSEWVKNEAAAAAERGVLVPALIETVKLPLEFRRKQTADLIDWNGIPSHGGFQAVCDGIAGTIGGVLPQQQTSPARNGRRWNPIWTIGATAGVVAVLGAYSVGLWPTRPAATDRTNPAATLPDKSATFRTPSTPEPPTAPKINQNPVVAPRKARVKDADGFVNVRSGPGTTFPVLGRVKTGETVQLRELHGAWWIIETPFRGGHIHQSRLVPSE